MDMEPNNIQPHVADPACESRSDGLAWVDIGSIHDIPLRGARCVRTLQGRIAVFRTADDQVFAMEDRCPHKAGPLSQGIVHGTSVTCPLHSMVISLETGHALGADEGAVRTVPIRNRDGLLSIALGSLSLLAAAE
jgi:nitrite reductase (NADH) small subunit